MTSIRTEYRQKRTALLKESILLLLDMLTLDKQELEKVHLTFFKNLKKAIEQRHFNRNYS